MMVTHNGRPRLTYKCTATSALFNTITFYQYWILRCIYNLPGNVYKKSKEAVIGRRCTGFSPPHHIMYGYKRTNGTLLNYYTSKTAKRLKVPVLLRLLICIYVIMMSEYLLFVL